MVSCAGTSHMLVVSERAPARRNACRSPTTPSVVTSPSPVSQAVRFTNSVSCQVQPGHLVRREHAVGELDAGLVELRLREPSCCGLRSRTAAASPTR